MRASDADRPSRALSRFRARRRRRRLRRRGRRIAAGAKGREDFRSVLRTRCRNRSSTSIFRMPSAASFATRRAARRQSPQSIVGSSEILLYTLHYTIVYSSQFDIIDEVDVAHRLKTERIAGRNQPADRGHRRAASASSQKHQQASFPGHSASARLKHALPTRAKMRFRQSPGHPRPDLIEAARPGSEATAAAWSKRSHA